MFLTLPLTQARTNAQLYTGLTHGYPTDDAPTRDPSPDDPPT